jgi:Na+/proline symporter
VAPNWYTLIIFVSYLVFTTLLGLWQTRRIKSSRDYAVTKMPVWQAAAFLSGFTLGGGSTYGIAGDSVKFGLTYLVWFPFSVALGWWLTGLLFARPYYRMGGVTLPTLLSQRFDGRTRLVTSLSTMLYALFVLLMEIYALATVIQAVLPALTFPQATLISFFVSVGSVAFSGMLGSSVTNLVHSGVILASFAVTLAVLWGIVGGPAAAFERVVAILPEVAHPGVDARVWLSITGLGWGTVGQLLIGKAGRIGGTSVVSNLAASCRSEGKAVEAFMLAGCISGIPPLLAGMVGVFTAALLGGRMADLPVYTSIGIAVVQTSPVLAGFLLAAIGAAILAAFGPIAITISTVLLEDIIAPVAHVTERQRRFWYPAIVVIVSTLAAIYTAIWGIKDILPFIYRTAFPTMIPPTMVAAAGIYSGRVSARAAFWSIALAVPAALCWGLLLHDPWGIHNIYISLLIPLAILGFSAIIPRVPAPRVQEWLAKVRTPGTSAEQ